jgi:hypothetical protein
MAVPTIRAFGTFATGTGAISPGLPEFTGVGDLLLMFIESGGAAALGEATPEPTATGWEKLLSEKNGNTRLTVLTKVAAGGDATTTSDTGDHQSAIIAGIREAIIHKSAIQTQASTKTVKCPSLETTVADCLVFLGYVGSLPDAKGEPGAEFSGHTNAALEFITERADFTSKEGDGGALGLASASKTTAGVVGETTITAVTEAPRVSATIAVANTPPPVPSLQLPYKTPHRGLIMWGNQIQ